MWKIAIKHQPRQIHTKYETSATPADRYGSPRIGKYGFLRQQSSVYGLILAIGLHFWPPPAIQKIATRHQTYQINTIYETAATPADRYGSTLIGKYGFLRQESAAFGLILAAVLQFWPPPTARHHVKNRHTTPTVPNTRKIRNRRNAHWPVSIPKGR